MEKATITSAKSRSSIDILPLVKLGSDKDPTEERLFLTLEEL